METKIAVVQFDSILGDIEANLEKMERFTAAGAAQGAHVVIFPETGTTGYFVGDRINELAEEVPGRTTQRLGEMARTHNTYVMSGMIEKADGGQMYNTAVLLSLDGKLAARYRKCHLFSAEKQFLLLGR
jgi:predicted amidohydrolase